MIKAHCKINGFVIYDFKSLEVAVGNTFEIITEGIPADAQIYTGPKDAYLQVSEDGQNCVVKATAEGEANIVWLRGGNAAHYIPIMVVAPEAEAVKFSVSTEVSPK